MKKSTRIALYFGSVSVQLIGTGFILMGLGYGLNGWCCWRQARGEETC